MQKAGAVVRTLIVKFLSQNQAKNDTEKVYNLSQKIIFFPLKTYPPFLRCFFHPKLDFKGVCNLKEPPPIQSIF
jgi:hypothetical protein